MAYDDATLHAILDLPGVIGIKVATLDSVMTFQRIAAAAAAATPTSCSSPARIASSATRIMLGARAALVGMGAALPDLQAGLLRAYADGDWPAFHARSALCDRLAEATFIAADGGLRAPDALGRRRRWGAAGRTPATTPGGRRFRRRSAPPSSAWCAMPSAMPTGSRVTSSASGAAARAMRPRTSARPTAST